MLRASIDTSLAHSLNSWGISHKSITTFAAKDLVYITIALGLFWVAFTSFNSLQKFSVGGFLKRAALDGIIVLAIPVGITTILSEVISKIYMRPRPFTAMSDIQLLVPHAADGGFPSHHMAFMTAIGISIFLRHRIAGFVLLALTIFCGFGRVAAGIHYPTDIVAGFALAVAVTVLASRILPRK